MKGCRTKESSLVLWRFRMGFSTAFNIVGMVFLGLALFLKTPIEISDALSLIGKEHVTKSVVWIMLVAGILSLVAGFITISICALQINHKPILYLYAGALFSMVFLQLITGAYVFYQRATVRQTLYGEFEKLPQVDFESVNSREYQVLRALQLKSECCGFTSGCLDWKRWSNTGVHMSPGCGCKLNDQQQVCRFYGKLNDTKTTCYDNTSKDLPIRTTTCHTKIASHVENRSTIFGSVLLVFSLAQLSGLMAAAMSLNHFGVDRTTNLAPYQDDVITQADGDVTIENDYVNEG